MREGERQRKKILAISGSIRESSSNTRILTAATKMFADEFNTEVFNGLKDLPFFDPGLQEEEKPPSVLTFIEKIASADAVIFCTPEYVFSLPGILKNALEWTVSTTVFSYKPVAFIIASASGEKAFESLDTILRTLVQEDIPADRKLLIRGGQGQINEAGEFIDALTLEKVRSVILAVVAQVT